MAELSLEEAESLSEAWNDAFVRREGWKDHSLKDPVFLIELLMRHMEGPSLLDAGCGWARYVSHFTRPGVVYTGLDHSTEAIRLARKTHPDLRFGVGSIARMPFSAESFDGIWSCCAVGSIPKAHIRDVLTEHIRVLTRTGVMLFVIPYPAFGVSEERLYTNDDGSPSIWQSHYELDEFCDHLKAVGLSIHEADIDFQNGSQYALVSL